MPLRRVLVAFLVLSSAAQADELRTLTGPPQRGTLQKINAVELELKTDAGVVKAPLSQILLLYVQDVQPPSSELKTVRVQLTDDSQLLCTQAKFLGTDVELELPNKTTFKVPLAAIVNFSRDGHQKDLAKKFDAIANKKLKRDRVVILREGELVALEGILGDVDAAAQKIKFKAEGTDKAVDVSFDRLQGLTFFRNEISNENPLCRVIDIDGNQIVAGKLAFENKKLTVTPLLGGSIELKVEHLAKLDFNFGRLTYLSDLEPSKVVEKSGIGLLVRHRKDVSLEGEPIVLEAVKYARGLSLHAYTELEYALGGKYKEFKVVLGVDPRSGSDSHPTVAIFCDNEQRFSETITSKGIRPVAINVKDVQTLRIVVSSGNLFDLHDHVTLADPRVSQ